MKPIRYVAASLALGALLALAPAAGAQTARPHTTGHALVKVTRIAPFGQLLVTSKGFALYTWAKEKPGKIACTGQCATVWPPLLIPKGTTPAAHIAGAMGTFGTILRPNKSVQLTYNGKAVYLFMSDTKPNQVLCDGVDGWHAIRATMH